MSGNEIVPFDEVFAEWQVMGRYGAPFWSTRVICWGKRDQVNGEQIIEAFGGVKIKYLVLNWLAGGPLIIGRHSRFADSFSCVGCPHYGVHIDFPPSGSCLHPFWIEIFGCPQHIARHGRFNSNSHCPKTTLRSERSRRRYRVRYKAKLIFWDYYQETGRDPYREGFSIP